MGRISWATATLVLAVTAVLVFALGAGAAGGHGLGGSKGCDSPTKIGDPLTCTFTIRNNSDEFGDTMRAYYVDDTVFGANGNASSGDIFDQLQWTADGAGITCWADNGLNDPNVAKTIPAAGSGTALDPWIGAKYCDLPSGTNLRSLPFSHYDVQPADFNLPGSTLGDTASYLAHDLCDAPNSSECPLVAVSASGAASTLIEKRDAGVDTFVHTATDHTNGTPTSAANPRTIVLGESVHDFVRATSTDGGPVPGGSVQIEWYTNTTCSGNPAATSAPIALNAAGEVDATGFSQTPTASGGGFVARYLGSGTYDAAAGVCEPVQVIAASLTLVKKTNGTDNTCPTGPTLAVGAAVIWTYDVTNTGNQTLTNIVVVDDNGTPANLADDVTVGTIVSLGPGASATLVRNGTAAAGQYVNVATASTTFTSGAITIPLSDSDNDCYFGQQPPAADAFTPGYWKNHRAHTTSLLPITLGNYAVNTFDGARDVFGGMNCGNSKPQSAIGCLAGHLLAAKLNVANGASTCIAGVIADADAFLKGMTVNGVPGINYTGPTGTYTLTGAQRTLVIAMKDALDSYNNDLGC